MANFNSTQHANFVADPRMMVRTQDLGGRVRVMRADFVAVDAAAADTLTLGRLPAGAQVLMLGIKNGAGAAGTMDVGFADDPDVYVDDHALTSAGDTVVNSVTYVRLDEEADIIATISANPGSIDYNFTVLYVVD